MFLLCTTTLLMSKAVVGMKTHFSFFLPCHASDLTLLSSSLLSLTPVSHFVSHHLKHLFFSAILPSP